MGEEGGERGVGVNLTRVDLAEGSSCEPGIKLSYSPPPLSPLRQIYKGN